MTHYNVPVRVRIALTVVGNFRLEISLYAPEYESESEIHVSNQLWFYWLIS